MRIPNIITTTTVRGTSIITETFGYLYIRRWYATYLVFTGKYDAVKWEEA